MVREVVVVITDGIVLVGAVEAVASVNRRAQGGKVLVVPPSVLHEVHAGGGEQGERSGDAQPAEAAARHNGGEKIEERDGEDGHPAPGELNKAKLRQNVPEDGSEAQHQGGGHRGEEKKCVPEFRLYPEGVRLRGFATRGEGRAAGEDHG